MSADDGVIEVLLVDDHPIVRDGIKAMLAECAHIRVSGEAVDGEDALGKTRELNPDVIVMDIGLPVMNGLEATKRLLACAPDTRVIILTVYDNKEYLLQAVHVGARGYIIKNAPSAELVEAIEAVHRGESYFPGELSGVVVDELTAHGDGDSVELSQRERQVLALIAEGCTNRDVAARLELSVRTIETHRKHIMTKIDIHTVAGLTKYAINRGITGID